MSMTSELVDKLRSIASSEVFYDDRIPSENAKIIKMAADTIEELSIKLHNSQMERSSMYYHNGWILVEEQLPEEQIDEITHNFHEYICSCDFNDEKYIRFYMFENGHWRNYSGGIVDQWIEAWMPLPIPYKRD